MKRSLTDEEINFCTDFLKDRGGNEVELYASSSLLNNLQDEMTTVKINPRKIKQFKETLLRRICDSSSLFGDSMIRPAQTASKTIIQNTISTKRGQSGRTNHVSSEASMREIKSYTKSRKRLDVYVHPSQPVHEFDNDYVKPSKEKYERLSNEVYSIFLQSLTESITISSDNSGRYWDSAAIPGEERVVLKLKINLLIKYEITLDMIKRVLAPHMEDFEIILSPFSVATIDIFPTSNYKNTIKASLGRTKNVVSKIRVRGIPGVIGVEVRETNATSAFSQFYRVVDSENKWRTKLSVSVLISAFMLEEDAIHYFSTVFDDFEYDDYTHYFYVTSDTKPDISPVNKQLTGHVLAMVINDVSIITGVLTDVRFDGERTLTNDLWGNFRRGGCEIAIQWYLFEIKLVSDDIFDLHTHHPLAERTFALGHPTPVTEKGNKERNAGVFPAITFKKGEETLRAAALEGTFDLNDNIYSCHKVGTPSPFGSNVRVGHNPYVSIYAELISEYNIAPHHGAVPERFIKPRVQYIGKDYTAGYGIEQPEIEIDMSPEQPYKDNEADDLVIVDY